MKKKIKHIYHGYHNTPIYGTWRDMKQRVYNKNNRNYKYYGGRGITICKEWNNPKVFIEWALANGWEKGLVIDRIDNDGNYCPENCRFITKSESAYNTRLLRSTNTSGYRGVSYSKHAKKWLVRIRTYNKRIYLGYFDSPRLAALRYDVEAYLLNDGRQRNFL